MKLVDFELLLGNEKTRKALLDSLVTESNARRKEWVPVFGPEIYEMKTGEMFQSAQKQLESSLLPAFPELEKSENHGKATDEIGPHGVTVDKSFVLAELSGKNGEKVMVEAYRGLDYRNWDGNVIHAEMADELVVAGHLPEKDLNKVFSVLKENAFLRQYKVRAFDNEVSKNALWKYKEFSKQKSTEKMPKVNLKGKKMNHSENHDFEK